MKILERHLSRTIISSTLSALTVLVVMQLVFSLIDEVNDVGKGTYTTWHAFEYVLLTTPRRIYENFPLAALLGSLLGLGSLANHSELIVMRASGVSVSRIVWSVCKTGAILVFVSVVIGEWMTPPLEREAQRVRINTQSTSLSMLREGGFWVRDGEYVVHVQSALPDGSLEKITLYHFAAQGELLDIAFAKRATYEIDHWLLSDVSRTQFFNEQENGALPTRSATQSKPVESWFGQLNPAVLEVVTVKPETLSIFELNRYINYLLANGLNADTYKFAFWNKVFIPLTTAVMLVLSLPFVFGSLRSSSQGTRLMIGVMLGITFYLANRLLGYSGLVYGLNALLCAALPTAAFLLLGMFGLYRIR